MTESRPTRHPDPKKNEAYWERVRRVVDQAPPLTGEQRAQIRVIFHKAAQLGSNA